MPRLEIRVWELRRALKGLRPYDTLAIETSPNIELSTKTFSVIREQAPIKEVIELQDSNNPKEG